MSILDEKYQSKQKLNEKEFAIIEYIRNNENEPKKLTINQVSSAMDEKGISSRSTTNKIIFNLMNLNIIKDEKIGNKFHRLKINDEYYYDFNKLEEELLKYQIQNVLEPFKTLLKNKKMEVHIVNKAEGKTDIIIGMKTASQNEKFLEETMARDLVRPAKDEYIPKPLDLYPTDDVFTPEQLQEISMREQKRVVKKTKKDLMNHARKYHKRKPEPK